MKTCGHTEVLGGCPRVPELPCLCISLPLKSGMGAQPRPFTLSRSPTRGEGGPNLFCKLGRRWVGEANLLANQSSQQAHLSDRATV